MSSDRIETAAQQVKRHGMQVCTRLFREENRSSRLDRKSWQMIGQEVMANDWTGSHGK